MHFTLDDIDNGERVDNGLSFTVTLGAGPRVGRVRVKGAGARYLDAPDVVKEWLLDLLNREADARGRELVEADLQTGELVATFSGLAALYADWQP